MLSFKLLVTHPTPGSFVAIETLVLGIGVSALLLHQWFFAWPPAPPLVPTRLRSAGRRVSRRFITIVIDGCRADRLLEANTPYIDRLRGEGADYVNASTVYPARTVTAFSSMQTGAPPKVHGMGSNFVPNLGVKCESIFDSLRASGMTGKLVGIAHLVDAFGDRDVETVTAVTDNDEIDEALAVACGDDDGGDEAASTQVAATTASTPAPTTAANTPTAQPTATPRMGEDRPSITIIDSTGTGTGSGTGTASGTATATAAGPVETGGLRIPTGLDAETEGPTKSDGYYTPTTNREIYQKISTDYQEIAKLTNVIKEGQPLPAAEIWLLYEAGSHTRLGSSSRTFRGFATGSTVNTPTRWPPPHKDARATSVGKAPLTSRSARPWTGHGKRPTTATPLRWRPRPERSTPASTPSSTSAQSGTSAGCWTTHRPATTTRWGPTRSKPWDSTGPFSPT